MVAHLDIGGTSIDVVRKDVKHIHLTVHPPEGRVRLTAPSRIRMETLRAYAIGKLGWIRQQQRKLISQRREAPREYVERESHYVWGKRYLLAVVEVDEPPGVTIRHSRLELRVRPGSDLARRRVLLDAWYREQLRLAMPRLLAKWQAQIGVEVERVHIQRMRTKWGSCNPGKRSIRLNTELAKKPRQYLEYIVVHELVHLIEPTHNARFLLLMDRCMPQWQFYREALNRLPVRHETWGY